MRLYYCYILLCSDNRYYVGATADLMKRLSAHHAGEVPSTRHRRPLQLAYFERFTTAQAAYRRERRLKDGRTRKTTRERLIASFPSEWLKPFTSSQ